MDAMRNRGIESIERMRSWLAGSHGMSVTLARELLKMVARPDQPSFGPYLPLAHLANGGMGSVWLATNRSQDGLVVVKSMRRDTAENPEFQKRFVRETKIMMELDSPGVVRCLDSGAASDGTLYMVLEFVDGGDLKDLAEGRGVPEAMALQFTCHVATALNEAHRRSLVHRDIKPANIFTYTDGRAKLADFGIARSTSEQRTMLTMSGAMIGSPPYMSPEQVIGAADIDIRSDIYSLGTVLYYALTGKDCYQGRMQEILHAQRTAPIPDVRAVIPAISQATADIIRTCMAKDRKDRYQDPAALAAAVAAALTALGHAPNANLEMFHVPARPNVAPTPEREVTEGMLSRLIDTDSNAQGDANALLAQRTPTNFPAGQFPPPGKDSGTTVTPAAAPVGESLQGDLATALTTPWLTLAGEQPGRLVMLFAKTRLDMGKLREPPIDLCLRNYPLDQHRDACQKVSRHHLDVVYDVARSTVVLIDAGGGNGTTVDQVRLTPNQPLTLSAGRDYQTLAAGAVELRVRSIAQRKGRITQLAGATPATSASICGLDTEHLCDAVTLLRPSNQTQVAYALVLRRIAIGGSGADLPINGATTAAACEIALFAGHWIWRVADSAESWKPLTNGTKLTLGGMNFTVRPGTYEDF